MTDISIQKISTPEDMAKCLGIRDIVFIQEQNVPPGEEIDGKDPAAIHYLLTVDGEAIATARVRHLDHIAKIERVAVLRSRRGLNIGRRLMEFIMDDIRRTPDIRQMKLGAQSHVVDFYEKLGFSAFGDEFLDAGIKHRWMKRDIRP